MPYNGFMAQDNTRNVEVKLKFSADAKQATGSMSDMQRQAERTRGAVKSAHEERANYEKKSASYEKQQGEEEKKRNVERLKFMAKIIGIGAVVSRVADGMTKAMNSFGDASISSGQKWANVIQDVAESVPLFGEFFKSLRGLSKEFTGQASELRGVNTLNQRNQIQGAVQGAYDPISMRHQDNIRANMISENEYNARGMDSSGNVTNSRDLERRLGTAGKGYGLSSDQQNNPAMRAALQASIDAQRNLGIAQKTAAYDK